MKLDRLTAQQEARLPEIAAEWLRVGLSCEPVDRDRATAAVHQLYRCGGLDEPERVIFLRSPLEGALAAAMMTNAQVGAQVRAQVWAQVRAQVWDQVRAQARAQVGDQVWAQVRDQVRAQVWAQVWAQVRDQVWDQVRDQVWAQVGAQVGAQVRAQVGAQVGDQVRDQVWAQVGAQVGVAVEGGHLSFWSAWVAAYQELGLDLPKAAGLVALSREAGWAWPLERLCIVTSRPCEIHMDAGRLHCETGPAIRYEDGFSVHAWNGRRVPAEWIESRSTLDPAAILACEDVELRAVGCEIVGWPRMLDKLKAKTVDDSGDEDVGALIHVALPGLKKPGAFLKARCPRNGWIVEGVPDADEDGRPIRTALHAQAWRVGLSPEEYRHPTRRT